MGGTWMDEALNNKDMRATHTMIQAIKEVLKQRDQLRVGTPLFDLPSFYFVASRDVRVISKTTCLCDLMWIANAYIVTRMYPPVLSLKTPQSFKLLKMPALFTNPIMEMTTQQIIKTADALMWAFDGDIFNDDERTPEWFDEVEEALELVRRRAYYLATNSLSQKDHDVEEFTVSREVHDAITLGNCDSDDENPDINVGELLARENKSTTELNEAFVWDMCSMLTHMDVSLRAFKIIERMPVDVSVGEERARLWGRAKDPNLWLDLRSVRIALECNLIANRADKRIYKRKVPLRTYVSSRMILAAKRPILNDDVRGRFAGTDARRPTSP